ncbi:hypothetical protein Aph01nite_74030 [Acrocarpospora phusangensis]|uniref:Uncharacterized protein n=1 Tax=Acrocarpospora phusangensis TaxID=1070424 RepID=A0A919QHW4_9ACTN|nr:hypothetical protein [Acrocarpospora phusangensis]GIH29093.1 hypothetical protein Aph01nite_74030 [Acrocarpospora phusangensis]
MAGFVLLNCRLFTGGADLTGQSNKIELSCELEEKPTTNYASEGWKEVIGSLFATKISGAGQWQAGDPGQVDDATWAELTGRTRHPWTVCPESADVGELAYFTDVLRGSYKLGEGVGEVAPWESSGSGSAPLLRGTAAHPPGTPRTATGTGTGLNLGALAEGQRMFAALHVLSIAGTDTPTITARVESDADNTWATPTTRATFAAATVRGGQFIASTAGPVTDTWWRIAWTITGTAPSFLFAAALGIA